MIRAFLTWHQRSWGIYDHSLLLLHLFCSYFRCFTLLAFQFLLPLFLFSTLPSFLSIIGLIITVLAILLTIRSVRIFVVRLFIGFLGSFVVFISIWLILRIIFSRIALAGIWLHYFPALFRFFKEFQICMFLKFAFIILFIVLIFLIFLPFWAALFFLILDFLHIF